MITEKELEELGFDKAGHLYHYTTFNNMMQDCRINYYIKDKSFTLEIKESVDETAELYLDIYSIQDLKEVIEHIDKLSEFMV